jgi:UDP-N-acetylmuramoyl-tripeptide--D-alanyl-D-alanine ligase
MNPMPAELTSRFVAQALGQPAPPGPDVAFTAVSTDSRTLPEGALFVPIRGKNFDGHDFIPSAIERKARGVLTQRAMAALRAVAVYKVPDTIAAFQKIAGAWRRRFTYPVAAVGGSVGKTTTKELLASALSARFKVVKTTGSRNGEIGVPMTLMEMTAEHDVAVVEIGIDEPGAMDRLHALVRPTAAVVTAIAAEHLEKLQNIETIAREEALLLVRTAAEGGQAFVNLDDPHLAPLVERLLTPKTSGFTLQEGPDRPRVLRGRAAVAAGELVVEGEGYTLPLPGAHNAANLMAAIAVARGLGVSPEEIRRGLESFQPLPGRSDLQKLPGGPLVLCDYYNANPASMAAALTTLASLPATGKKWACLADMLELGRDEEQLHRDLAGPLMRSGATHVLLAGKRMAALAAELKARGYPGRVTHFADVEALAKAFSSQVREEDAVLLKGSRSMRMERAWDALTLPINPPG